jgi:hypothetical protein
LQLQGFVVSNSRIERFNIKVGKFLSSEVDYDEYDESQIII